MEDAADVLATDEATSLYILNQAVAQVVEFVFATQQQPLPRIKDRLKSLYKVDVAVGSAVQQYYQPGSAVKKYALAKALVLRVTGAAEFFEWTSTPA